MVKGGTYMKEERGDDGRKEGKGMEGKERDGEGGRE